jgi:CheY-like chemotaxis protein
MLLESLGFRVGTAADGESGLERIRAGAPDVVLVDLGLPGQDGCQVARKVRQELGDSLRLVAMSGFSRPVDVAAALEAGFDMHLVKSADPDGLVSVLEAFLG